MITVTFEHAIGDTVVIKGSSIEAQVSSLCKDSHGEQYLIAYWYSGQRYQVWVFPFELLAKPAKPASLCVVDPL